MLTNDMFIKTGAGICEEYSEYDPAPMFRKEFALQKTGKISLRICALGIGYCTLNGVKISEDLFTAPVSDYRKTLWYNEYDVSSLVQVGKNVIAVWCGNGFYNESFDSAWKHNKAQWRDAPKVALELFTDNEQRILISDDSWKCSVDSAICFNQLRVGEGFDFTRYDENWDKLGFDDSRWQNAVKDETPPAGIFRKCECNGIRESESFPAIKCWSSKNGYIFDIGQNISGYVLLQYKGERGERLVINHAEAVDENGELNYNNLNRHYPTVPVQQDFVICNGHEIKWKPKFTYHGFRYVEITGCRHAPALKSVCGIFVHQQLPRRADFHCSDAFLNRVYHCSIMSSYSNFFYSVTDCPTREKLGWTNDAVASLEQMFINFEFAPLIKKWYRDILDTMREDGSVSGIAPSPDWGYNQGPVTDCCLYKIPLAYYEFTTDDTLIAESIPYVEKYLRYYEPKVYLEEPQFGLADWNGSLNAATPRKFVEELFLLEILSYLMRFGKATGRYKEYCEKYKTIKNIVLYKYIDEKSGKLNVETPTAVAMFIMQDIADNYILYKQLTKILEKNDSLTDCGMLGTQYVPKALLRYGDGERIYSIMSNPEGIYHKMLDNGATTLWETVYPTPKTLSLNHHIFSNMTTFFFEGILGVHKKENVIEINPIYVEKLSFAEGYIMGKYGKTEIFWRKETNKITLRINVSENVVCFYKGKRLSKGENVFEI